MSVIVQRKIILCRSHTLYSLCTLFNYLYVSVMWVWKLIKVFCIIDRMSHRKPPCYAQSSSNQMLYTIIITTGNTQYCCFFIIYLITIILYFVLFVFRKKSLSINLHLLLFFYRRWLINFWTAFIDFRARPFRHTKYDITGYEQRRDKYAYNVQIVVLHRIQVHGSRPQLWCSLMTNHVLWPIDSCVEWSHWLIPERVWRLLCFVTVSSRNIHLIK